ncbi:MAG: hypothetical protein ACPGQL_04890 [Thermoplasmatota archaeon]
MQAMTDTAPHFEQLTRALGDKIGSEIDETELKAEFQKYLDYGVPVDQAVRTILRHHGAPTSPPPAAAANAAGSVDTSEPVPLADVPPGLPVVTLKARLQTLNTKVITARGEQKEILWGLLADPTGTLPYTSWRPLEGLEKGDVVRIEGAYTKEFNGETQVNFGDRSRIEKLDPSELPDTAPEIRDVPIAEVRQGLRGFRITGRILDVSSREVMARGEPKMLWNGTIADDSGKVAFTSWHDHGLAAEQVVTIEGGYVRAFRGMPQFTFDEQATVTKADDVELPSAEELDQAQRTTLAEVIDQNGGSDVSLVATLLEVRPGSGLVFRDPETRRVLMANQVDATSVPDLRIKAVLDDGTGAVNAFIGREITEGLLGKGLEACQAEAKEAMRYEVIQDQLADMLTGRVFRVRGDVLSDDYGLTLMARQFTAHETDVKEEAARLLKRVDEAQEGL